MVRAPQGERCPSRPFFSGERGRERGGGSDLKVSKTGAEQREICGGGPPIVNFTSTNTTSSTPSNQSAPHLSPRSPLQAAVASHNTESHTLMVHGRPTHLTQAPPWCTTTDQTTSQFEPKHMNIPRGLHLQPPFNRVVWHLGAASTLDSADTPVRRHKSPSDQRLMPTPTPRASTSVMDCAEMIPYPQEPEKITLVGHPIRPFESLSGELRGSVQCEVKIKFFLHLVPETLRRWNLSDLRERLRERDFDALKLADVTAQVLKVSREHVQPAGRLDHGAPRSLSDLPWLKSLPQLLPSTASQISKVL